MRNRCECGRKALAFRRPKKRSSRKARAGVPVCVKGHFLCVGCFCRYRDSLRAMGC